MLYEVFKNLKEEELKNATYYDLKAVRIYKRLDKLKGSFANKKIRRFLLKRLDFDKFAKTDLAIAGILGLWWYETLKVTKEFHISDKSSLEALVKIMGENNQDYLYSTIEFLDFVASSVFPEAKEKIVLKKALNKFPYCLGM